MAQFTVIDHMGQGHVLKAGKGRTLAQAIYLHGRFPAPPLCSGLGRCRQCRVRFVSAPPAPCDAEVLAFSPEELEAGWRLACRHQPAAGMCLILPEPRLHPKADTAAGAWDATAGQPVSLAVDLGTTSLHWQVLAGGRVLASGTEVNPQMGAGSEIMSRIAYVQAHPEGGRTLQRLVLDRLRAIVRNAPARPESCCVAGNSVMTYIALGKPIDGLAHAPYRLEYMGGEIATVDGLPDMYVPPLFGPFVGGDLSAGLAWLCAGGSVSPEYPFMLADMGTNGEFILAAAPDAFMAASVPLGPALEGIGLTFGAMAEPGVATAFTLTPSGVTATVMGGGAPHAITGTGYLSLVHALYKAGLLDFEGRFAATAPASPLAARLAATLYEVRGERRFPLPGSMYLAARDIEEILKVKAAFNIAFARLLDSVGFSPADLQGVWLAGAMGEHVSPDDLEGLGFLPEGMGRLARIAGNSSLAGARLFLERPDMRAWAETAAYALQVIDLVDEPNFSDEFVARMGFVYVP
ncbi:MAG: ASKHA domain-containing protein [Desulfovibrionaceae bacterium]